MKRSRYSQPKEINEGGEILSVNSHKSGDSLYTPVIASHEMFSNTKRGYISSHLKPLFTVPGSNPSSDLKELGSSSESSISTQVFWGTNINIQGVFNDFRQFLLNFKLEGEINQKENYYHRLLKEISETKLFILNINGNHISSFSKELYWKLTNFPSEMIPLMDSIATNVYHEIIRVRSEKLNEQIQVRITHLTKLNRVRDLNVSDIDKLISVSGIVTRVGDIIPEMREAYFKCTICGERKRSKLEKTTITEPSECPKCKVRDSFRLMHNYSSFNDRQIIKLQETPEMMPEGETPVTLYCCCYDELVDTVKPGDRVEIVGIYRAQSIRVNPNQRILKTTYRTYIDIIYISKNNTKRLFNDYEEMTDTPELQEDKGNIYSAEILQKVEELKNMPNIYNILVDAFAPSIFENDDVKRGLLLQLFGGVSKDFSKSGHGKFRGDINVLLVGDPSTAKSQLLQYVHGVAPRGIYTSGKGSSVVGLTAYVTKDPETREIILESGALVLSDKGICCIDEFDKMDDGTKTILHEAMEQQTISIAKAGIICTLNARTAILASANPIGSKYNPKLSVVQNIKLPPSLLSRFDLIYLMLDKKSEVYDRKLANHIVSLYGNVNEEEFGMEIDDDEENTNKKVNIKKEKNSNQEEIFNGHITRELLVAYINEAKKITPKITDEIQSRLTQIYINMRKIGNGKNTISATPRQLESVIRLAEARARLRFSETIELEDVEEAKRLIESATQQAATDPVTGVIDMDMIATGKSTSSIKQVKELYTTLKVILRDHSGVARRGVKSSSLLAELRNKIEAKGHSSFSFTDFDYYDALKLLEDEGIISILGNKRAPTIRLINFEEYN